jgi:ribosomal protein L11 methyltransferase
VTKAPRTLALTFRVPLEVQDSLQGFMLTQTTLEGLEETSNGEIRYFIPVGEWDDTLRDELAEFLQSLPAEVELRSVEPIEEKDWNAEWEAGIEPVEVTDDLVISPSWKEEEAEAIGSKYVIIIDPKMSFGTGHHETTRLCLRAIEKIPVPKMSVLDVGTGSGVLAIYALMRGAAKAVGVDTDDWAVENVEENRDLNGIAANRFTVYCGTLETTVDEAETFDLILANIHRNILVESKLRIASHAKPGSMLVLSGLLVYDAAEVTEQYRAAGYQLIEELRETEWSALLMKYDG